ncbi:unnamed protein product [Spirodela intermedia]|uniref:BTB domain-containing protein n=1 Tax=Spirodela intermedia TaxID=51605 RepID=A0A7I8L3U8_SPIIN|nr:unnamed protein product [Spirodela intermedia]
MNCGGGSVGSASSDSKVETISRLAQWRIESFGLCTYRRSDAFKVGIWNWYMSVEKNRYMYIRLFPEPCRLSKEQPPIAKFVLRVSNVGPGRRPYISPVHERLLRTSDDFVWPIDSTFNGKFIIDVEFLDLKISLVNGGEPSSIWPSEGSMQSLASKSSRQCLSRMLEENIHSDITINTPGGTLRAHKAILSASSPVFQSMFLHDLRENSSSVVEIEDMSLEACGALLNYLYGIVRQEEFWKHRSELLAAADKYDLGDLKLCCEESLLEDLSSGNVLQRLRDAWIYRLERLKKGCFSFLFDFGKIYDVRDDINGFFRCADHELVAEMFQEVLTLWKPV